MPETPHAGELSASLRHRWCAAAGAGAYLLTAVEAGFLAGLLVVATGWPLGRALVIALVAALPLIPLQTWAILRLRGGSGAPPTARTPTSRRREAVIGAGTVLGFLATAPLVLLGGTLCAGLLLAGTWAIELAGAGGDLTAQLQARADGFALHEIPRWVLVATAAFVFAGYGALAVAWTLVLGRLRGERMQPAMKRGLAWHLPRRAHVIAAVLGGLSVGWLPGMVAETLETSPRYLAAVRAVGLEPTSLGWLEASLTTGDLGSRLVMAGVVACLGPLVEEIVFRGFLWSALERWMSRGVVLLITSAAFALAHLDPVHAPAVLLTGLFLGWLRLASGSIVPALITHGVNNGLGVLLATSAVAGIDVMPDPTAWALGALTLVVGATVWTTRRQTRYRIAVV